MDITIQITPDMSGLTRMAMIRIGMMLRSGATAALRCPKTLRSKRKNALQAHACFASERAHPVERTIEMGKQLHAQDVVDWAVSQWQAEVANRPLQNVHRRALDGVWRQVIRHFGGDDIVLCGPRHDELVSP